MTEFVPCERLLFLDLAPRTVAARRFSRSGQSVSTQMGPGYWIAKIETARVTMAQARIWSAWLARREVDRVPFYAWRLMRTQPSLPLSVPDGSLSISADAANSRITISGCGAYSPRVGDMISYLTDAGGVFLGEVLQDADCTAVQDAVTVDIWPRPTQPAATPNVRRVKAYGEFILSNPPEPFEDYSNRVIKLEARQIIR